ncbi:MAG: gamma-glutamyltransferase family protein [Tissierellia bacterium]|nr:gamma-glutamyltransferase family protein [Tissierellia bacterium]
MKFDFRDYPYPSKRNVVFAKNGMVCAGNPTATSAGLRILQRGGNAIDAAIATAATLPVTEPTGNGLGCDCFAIIWYRGKMYGLNSSGRAPKSVSIQKLKDRGYDKIPPYGVIPTNTPGGVGGWMEMHNKFGSLSLEEIFEPAISYAENGYPVSPNISRLWEEAFEIYSQFKDKEEFSEWFKVFAPENRHLYPGELFVNKDIARTLNSIAKTHGKSFYHGEFAEKIDEFMKKHGGYLTKEDMMEYEAEWVEPISTNYRGYDIWELPPNGHGITVLMALNILKGFEFEAGRDHVDTMHKQIEAMKLTMTDTAKFITDPKHMKYTPEQLLSEKYANYRRKSIGQFAIEPEAGDPKYNSTVYFCTADGEGNMVSMIQSNFRGFGSGIVIPGTGITLNDRMENFQFNEDHDNSLQGGKLPYHTIIPAFITKDKKAIGPFGIMGGFMQPQAHVQVVMNMVDFGLNPQAALDAPRFQWTGGKNVEVEQDTPNHIIRLLQRRGHNIIVQPDPYHMGRGQMILKNDEGILCGATEKRTDGHISAY